MGSCPRLRPRDSSSRRCSTERPRRSTSPTSRSSASSRDAGPSPPRSCNGRRGVAVMRSPVLRGVVSLVLTALLVVWLTDAALSSVKLGDLTLGLLLAGRTPFRDLSLTEAVLTAVSRSAILVGAALGLAVIVGLSSGVAYAFSSWRVVRGLAWSLGPVGTSLP